MNQPAKENASRLGARRAGLGARRAGAVVWLALVMGAAALPAGGCGPTTSGIEGISCTNDGDCNTGLKCLPYEVYADGGDAGLCMPLGHECLRPCGSTADCTEGPGLTCVTFCGGTSACEATADLYPPQDGGVEGEAGPESSTEAATEASSVPEAAAEAASEASTD